MNRRPLRWRDVMRSYAAWFCVWLFGMVCLSAAAWAEPIALANVPQGSLGLQATYASEQAGARLELAQAMQLHQRGGFVPGRQPVLAFGIGARPVWVRMQLDNPTGRALPVRLTVGTTWIDQLEVYVVRDGMVEAAWQTGDSHRLAFGLVPAMGFVFEPRFGPGASEVYLRAQTDDPLVLPIRLRLLEQAPGLDESASQFSYGLLYGFLVALAIYNGTLFLGLRKRSYLYYALYLATFILLNVSYTGHGAAWLWPAAPGFQRYVILVLMVLVSVTGLLFASRFLSLNEHAPRALRGVRWFSVAGVALLVACMALGSQRGAALVAFNWITLYTLLMVGLGVLAVRHGQTAGRYFLVASLCGMLGAVVTTLAVWGWLPFNAWSYRAAEIGILFEATLLALALAAQVRLQEAARQNAEQLARTDALTGLPNRRAFLESAEPIWSTAVRNSRPLSLIMLDIDFFKQINDRHGHEVGDRVLVEVARLLRLGHRAGDILARWGGEEFVLLLPETELAQACALAERLRQLVAGGRLTDRRKLVAFTASFGVAERAGHAGLPELMNEADARLYEAKSSGRNCVAA